MNFLFFSWITIFSVGGFALKNGPLGPYNISPDSVTVSGLSSGGFMTSQVHVAFSSIFKGAAVFAGGPFYCTQNGLQHCNVEDLGKAPDTEKIIELTKQFESEGKIDPTSNLLNSPTFVWIGKYDTVVGRQVGLSTEEYYSNFVNSSHLRMGHTFPAQHCLPTLDFGEECAKLRPPFIGNCGYDGAGDALQHLYGQLNSPISAIDENLFEFDQTPYNPDPEKSSLSDRGYIYVPSACQDATRVCKLHFSFHGCTQTEQIMGKTWAAHGGYNGWAESNNIVIVYPNAGMTLPGNPGGCWDFWGLTGSDYAFQTGLQMRFVRSLVTAVSGI